VLLAGGIGITRFRSIVVNAAKEKLPHRFFLFYSNRRPEDAAFLEELQAIETQNANYKLIATMTEIEKSARSWKGEVGMIDYQMLYRHLKSAAFLEWYSAGPIYYIAGPPQMVRDLQAMLTNAGVDSDDIRIEEFNEFGCQTSRQMREKIPIWRAILRKAFGAADI
jgi:ferredoxin-NADP reductase